MIIYDEFRFSFASSCRPRNDDLESRIYANTKERKEILYF
ncbi:hypothetical protein HFN_1619 [Helicobacter fennelliae MRY12-0050]|uniref:Uncharacterized protein n=1 Tax=Helicobacter fennelliae MRY12-0050 TaxID=1325130 RepID=T1CYJ7_9HELI|nr:hypothetical protein HFN_1619 [Helicobacter fennelliae MRY12-0050]